MVALNAMIRVLRTDLITVLLVTTGDIYNASGGDISVLKGGKFD